MSETDRRLDVLIAGIDRLCELLTPPPAPEPEPEPETVELREPAAAETPPETPAAAKRKRR